MSSGFDSYCTDACGWVAAVAAALSYGSFGVPIKATKDVDVWPLVYQSYKTVIMFLTCWLVYFLGVEIAFTKWGLLSGLLWVLGGTSGVAAIRLAGLSVAVGTWASVMVLVNFVFGILVFREPVADVWGTLGGFSLLIVGLVGMSHFSAPQKNGHQGGEPSVDATEQQGDEEGATADGFYEPSTDYQSMQDHSPVRERTVVNESVVEMEPPSEPASPGDAEPLVTDGVVADSCQEEYYLVLCSGQVSLTKRQCGIIGAVANGFLTGGSLIPLHYAKNEGFGGAKYFPSMACGALITNVLIWVVYFAVRTIIDWKQGRTIHDTLNNLPQWHFRVLCLPASLSGLLLSIAMFSSIIAVTYLGQGVGNSLVQTKILVSGLWGIFFYHEIVGGATIAKWFASAALTVLAIVWLSLERLEATGGSGVDH